MSIVLWGISALTAGLLMLWVVARRAIPAGDPLPAGTDLPATILQRISRWTVVLGALLAAAAGALVAFRGPEATFEDASLRAVFTLLLLAVLCVAATATAWLKIQEARDTRALDERDEEILARAPAVQAGGILVTLAVWTIGVAERFHDAGTVPLAYVYLIFWSCVVVSLLGLPVGVLAGYRKH